MPNELPKRKTIRLAKYDYSQAGYYFVTICTESRTHLFWTGERAGLGPAPTNPLGNIVLDIWNDLPNHAPGVRTDKFIVMPNHVHGVIILGAVPGGCVGAGPRPARTTALAEVVRQFKTFSARKINIARGTPGAPVSQRGYYDHIIRNEADYQRIWQYIDDNPAKWVEDEYYSA